MKKQGFTLIELLVVLTILGFFVGMMTKVFIKQDDQRRFEETRVKMEEIKKAILGSEGAYANGQRQFAGYAADMGGLPALDDMGTPADLTDDQPKALWEQGTLPDWKYKDTPKIWMGWRGPYLETPHQGDNILRDGWGNPFIFLKDSIPDDTCDEIKNEITLESGDMAIISLGVDNACGETGVFDENLIVVIRQTEYMAPVAGRVTGFSAGNEDDVRVRIYFPEVGAETWYRIDGIDADGNFSFVNGVTVTKADGTTPTLNENPIPVGVRSIDISLDSGGDWDTAYVFTVEPTGNWLGDIEMSP